MLFDLNLTDPLDPIQRPQVKTPTLDGVHEFSLQSLCCNSVQPDPRCRTDEDPITERRIYETAARRRPDSWCNGRRRGLDIQL